MKHMCAYAILWPADHGLTHVYEAPEATAANVHGGGRRGLGVMPASAAAAVLGPARVTATARSQSERKRERPCVRARSERYIGGLPSTDKNQYLGSG